MIQSKSYLQSIVAYKAAPVPAEAIKMSANENPLGTSPMVVKCIQAMANKAYQYPDGNSTQLKEALADRYKLKAENFIIGNGSDEIFTLLAHVYMQENSNAITSEITFSEYSFATRIFGGNVIQTALNKGYFDLDAITKAVNDESKLIFLCNPNNPTGTYFSHDELNNFMKKIPETVLVILDEAYADYMDCCDSPDIQELISSYSNIIVLRTFSKIYGLAGLRIGYGMAQKHIISDLDRVREPFNSNSLAQAAACAALSDDEFKALSLSNNLKGKEFLYRQLDDLGLTYYPTQGNFICIDLKTDCRKAFQALLTQGLIIRPLSSFGLNNWIRVTIGKPEDNRFFIDCLGRFIDNGNKDK